MSTDFVDALPPTQYLVLEVLAARERLGEHYWTFRTRDRPAIAALEELGLVWSRSAPTPNAVQVSLTDKGRAEVLAESYAAPLAAAEVRGYRRAITRLREEADRRNAEKASSGLTAWAVYLAAADYLEASTDEH